MSDMSAAASAPANALVAAPEDAKYDTVAALRRVIGQDARFAWSDLHDTIAAPTPPYQLLARRRGVLPEHDLGGDDGKLAALLEEDSIPQYIWPAARPMLKWIVAHRDLFCGKTVLELGCGTGVVGVTVACFAKRVVLTDCSPVALAMVLESVQRNRLHNCDVAALAWGRVDQLTHIKRACGVDAFDVVVGSDVFYFSNSLRCGLATARQALTGREPRDAIFLCGSVARSERMEFDLEEMPPQEGFELAHFVAEEEFYLYRWKLRRAARETHD